MTDQIDILVFNTSSVITLAGPNEARTGSDMQNLSEVKNGAVAIKDGKIVETGTTQDLLKKYYNNTITFINAEKKLVIPGFVDCHTHLVFAGSREYEVNMRINGDSYLDILKAGGGILSTVTETREASHKKLAENALFWMNKMLAHGTTSVEIKSGYGLEEKSEEKILKVIRKLEKFHCLDVVSTFLGAHTIPKDVDRVDYVNWIITDALPKFKNLAEFCDIFTEQGAFDYDETEKILEAAKNNGYKLKIHSGQFNDLGATGLAAKLGAVSCDHLENVSLEQLKLMQQNKTVAVLMPGVPFFLMSDIYPNARQIIDAKVPVALATDFNPGSCPSFSMQMIIALACYNMKMTAEEAIVAATINAAFAIDRQNEIGSIESGKKADLLILDVTLAKQIPYFFGTNLVNTVIKAGKIEYKRQTKKS